MNDQSFPLDRVDPKIRRPSTRSNVTLSKLMDEPLLQRKTPLGTDTAWALKLKTCVDIVARELHIDVLAAKPIKCFGKEDTRDMLFEVDTSLGPLEVTRARSGEYTFNWKCDGVQTAASNSAVESTH